jgi:hypothetical protein
MNDQIIELFRERLSRDFPDMLPEVDERAARVEGDSPHVRLTAIVLAGYQALLKRVPRAQALDLVGKAFHEPIYGVVHDATLAALDASDDAFATMVDFSKDREDNYFGVDFTFVRSADDGQRYHVDVHRCRYVEVLTREGSPELGPVFCEFDAAWISAIDRERHGIDFQRPTTIARGGSTCPFQFSRTTG